VLQSPLFVSESQLLLENRNSQVVDLLTATACGFEASLNSFCTYCAQAMIANIDRQPEHKGLKM
jgi:hypothetical protein